MEEIRSWYEVPSIAHFCSLFRAAFNLSDFDIEELEEGLLASGTLDGSVFITDLVCRLLNGCYGRKDIEEYNMEMYLLDILKIRYTMDTGRANPMEDIPEFRNLSLRTKVEVIHELCNFRLDADDVSEVLKGLDGDNLRIEPLGLDNYGATYWYFYGTRLYKEDPLPPPPPPPAKKGKDKRKSKQKSKQKAKQKDKKKKGKHGSKAKSKKKRGRTKKDEVDEDDEEDEEEDAVEEGVSPPIMAPPRWHLICSTLEQWEELAQGFKGSKTKCEKDLYKVLRDDFLPEMPQMFDQKEKALKKKLLELAPKRTSGRINRKKAEREEQEKLMKLLDEEDRQQREKYEEERRKMTEAQRQEEQRSKREERARVKEDRARRARMREERAEYVSKGIEVPSHLLNLEEHSQDSFPKSDDLDEDVIVSMFKVLEAVRSHKEAWPFWEPVSDEIAPGYSDIIDTPMDLTSIERKLNKREYKSRGSFIEDFELIFENCIDYNGPDSDYTGMARNVQKCLHKILKKYLPLEEFDSDEEFQAENGNPSIAYKKFRPQRAASSRALEALHYAEDESLSSSRSNSPFSQDESSPGSPAQRLTMISMKGELGAGDSTTHEKTLRMNPLSTEALVGRSAGAVTKSTGTIPITVRQMNAKTQPNAHVLNPVLQGQRAAVQHVIGANTKVVRMASGQYQISNMPLGDSGSQQPRMVLLANPNQTSNTSGVQVVRAGPPPLVHDKQTRILTPQGINSVRPTFHSSMPQIVVHPGPKHKVLGHTSVGGTVVSGMPQRMVLLPAGARPTGATVHAGQPRFMVVGQASVSQGMRLQAQSPAVQMQTGPSQLVRLQAGNTRGIALPLNPQGYVNVQHNGLASISNQKPPKVDGALSNLDLLCQASLDVDSSSSQNAKGYSSRAQPISQNPQSANGQKEVLLTISNTGEQEVLNMPRNAPGGEAGNRLQASTISGNQNNSSNTQNIHAPHSSSSVTQDLSTATENSAVQSSHHLPVPSGVLQKTQSVDQLRTVQNGSESANSDNRNSPSSNAVISQVSSSHLENHGTNSVKRPVEAPNTKDEPSPKIWRMGLDDFDDARKTSTTVSTPSVSVPSNTLNHPIPNNRAFSVISHAQPAIPAQQIVNGQQHQQPVTFAGFPQGRPVSLMQTTSNIVRPVFTQNMVGRLPVTAGVQNAMHLQSGLYLQGISRPAPVKVNQVVPQAGLAPRGQLVGLQPNHPMYKQFLPTHQGSQLQPGQTRLQLVTPGVRPGHHLQAGPRSVVPHMLNGANVYTAGVPRTSYH